MTTSSYKNDLLLLQKMLGELNTSTKIKKEEPRTQDLGELIAIFNTHDIIDSENEDNNYSVESSKNVILDSSAKAEITNEERNKLSELFNEFCKKIECKACMKAFSTRTALQSHYVKNPECVKWNELQIEQSDFISPKRGIHLWLYDILEQIIAESPEKSLQCKFCNKTFINKGNHRKHFNTSTVCNRLAFYQLKNLIDSRIIHNAKNST